MRKIHIAALRDAGAKTLRGLDQAGGFLRRPRKAWLVYLSALLLPMLIVGALWAIHGVAPFGKYMILAHDQWHQYYPFFLELREKLQNGGSLFYSWTTGMGINYLSMFAYYLASPMNFLSALVPDSLVLYYYTFTVLLKIGLAGLFCAVFLSRLFERRDFSVSFFSLLYALCSFIMGYYWNAIWLDTVALLPLVALGTIALLRDKKFILYTSMLALSILCSYYIGLFVCIFVLLLFIGYNFCNWDDLGGFFSRLGRIAFFTVLALGMTALLTIPAYLGLQTTSSAVNKFPTGFDINISSENNWMGVIDAVRQIISNGGAFVIPTAFDELLPNIYCGVITLILAVIYCCCKKVPVREKIFCCFLLLFFIASFIFRQLDYIWHGFHFPNMLYFRFSFLYSFVLIFMAYRAFTQLGRFKWHYCLYLLPVMVVFLFCVFTARGERSIVATTAIVLASGAVLFLYGKKRLTRNHVTVFVCACILAESIVCAALGVDNVGMTSKSVYPKLKADVQQVLSAMEERESKTVDRWRAEMTLPQSLNDSALNGYTGVSTFSSAANSRVSAFAATIGLSGSVGGNRYIYKEAPPLTNLLLGVKYLIDREGLHVDQTYFTEVASSGEVLLLENNAYLPMGFMLPEAVLDYDTTGKSAAQTASYNRFHNLNELYRYMSGSSDTLFVDVPISSTETIGDATLTRTAEGKYSLVGDEADADAGAWFNYEMTSDCSLCIYFYGYNVKNAEFYVNDEHQCSISCNNIGYLRYAGEFHSGDKVSVKFIPTKGATATVIMHGADFQTEVFDRLYQALSRQTMTATSVTDTSIEGNIVVEESGLFYTSIPYESGWTAKVDGVTVNITPAFDAFVAFHLEEGEHTISLNYETPGFSVGVKISFVCAAVFLLLVVLYLLYRITQRPFTKVQVEMCGLPQPSAPEKVPEEEAPETGSAQTMPALELTRIMEPIASRDENAEKTALPEKEENVLAAADEILELISQDEASDTDTE